MTTSTTATFFVPGDSPYIDSCLTLYNGHLSTTATVTEACCQEPKKGNLSNDDGDGNENSQKGYRLD